MSKSTTDFKMYLNSILNDVDPKIHNELWNHLIAVISEEQQILNGETLESEITSEKFEQTPMSGELIAASNQVVTDILFG